MGNRNRANVEGQSVIRASDVGRYAFCARAWWLQRIKGFTPTNQRALDAGTRNHQTHGEVVRRAQGTAIAARWFLYAAMLVGALFLISTLLK